MKMKNVIYYALLALAAMLPLALLTAAEQITIKLVRVDPIPVSYTGPDRQRLEERWRDLTDERNGIRAEVRTINEKPPVPVDSEEYAGRRKKLLEKASDARALSVRIEKFNAELKTAVAANAGAPGWPGTWPEKEKDEVTAMLGRIPRTEYREWLKAKAEKIRVAAPTDSVPTSVVATSGMISANGTQLTFKNAFFEKQVGGNQRLNLLAFEGGKVFWAMHKGDTLSNGQTLEEWHAKFVNANPGLLDSLKKAKHAGYSLSELGDLADSQSQFAHVFRAAALGMKAPQWRSELETFHDQIAPFLKR
jgi:hypothetical protein